MLKSLQRKQSLALSPSEKAAVISTQLTVCIARTLTPFTFKGHHHLQSQTTGV